MKIDFYVAKGRNKRKTFETLHESHAIKTFFRIINGSFVIKVNAYKESFFYIKPFDGFI